MYKALCTGAVNINTSAWQEALYAARLGGFEGVEISANGIYDSVTQDGLESVQAAFQKAGVRPAGFNLPVEWRTDEGTWRTGLERLPALAEAASALGCRRAVTYIWPCSDTLSFEDNWKFHVERFAPIAAILKEFDVALGLEFLGPKTLRDEKPFPFVYTMGEMLRLAEAIGGNTGLLLDIWHWHTSGGTLEELRALRPEQVVYVHLNDAPRGLHADEQRDLVREMPATTGVLDTVGFLRTLRDIGYDGPVVVEPFHSPLTTLRSDAHRLCAVRDSLDRAFALAF